MTRVVTTSINRVQVIAAFSRFLRRIKHVQFSNWGTQSIRPITFFRICLTSSIFSRLFWLFQVVKYCPRKFHHSRFLYRKPFPPTIPSTSPDDSSKEMLGIGDLFQNLNKKVTNHVVTQYRKMFPSPSQPNAIRQHNTSRSLPNVHRSKTANSTTFQFCPKPGSPPNISSKNFKSIPIP